MLSKRSLPLTIISLTIIVGILAIYFFLTHTPAKSPPINIDNIDTETLIYNDTVKRLNALDFSRVETKTADTRNWKDYIDTRLGFKTKIPPDWEVKPLPAHYEGADFFVMFNKKGDVNKVEVAELIFSTYWNSTINPNTDSNLNPDPELNPNPNVQPDAIKLYNTKFYTYKQFKVVKSTIPLTEERDPENRWEGDTLLGYTVYLDDHKSVRSFAILLFSPQIDANESDLIINGILEYLERI